MGRRLSSALFLTLVAVIPGGGVVAEDPASATCLRFDAPADTSDETLESAAGILVDRLAASGIAAEAATDADTDSIGLRLLPGPDHLEAASELAASLGAVGDVRFVPLPRSCPADVATGAPAPSCLAETPPLFDGSNVTTAIAREESHSGEAVVDIKLDEHAARLFDEHAEQHLFERFAILLDGSVVVAPTIHAPHFGGAATITGGFSEAEARSLAAIFSTGALPVSLALGDIGTCAAPILAEE